MKKRKLKKQKSIELKNLKKIHKKSKPIGKCINVEDIKDGVRFTVKFKGL